MHLLQYIYIYVSVKDLAELTSEGETLEGTQSAGAWGGTLLRRGSSGTAVEQVQFWLSSLAQFDDALPAVSVDGSFGAATESAVKAFQSANDLTADGIVGQATWEALYAAWVGVQSDLGGTAWPGTVLRSGSKGSAVRLVQFWLRLAADNYGVLSPVTVDGTFGTGTQTAVEAFQTLFGLSADGAVGRATWAKLNEVGLAVANDLVEKDTAPGVFPGTLRQGDTGTGVRAVQYYLRRLAAYYDTVPAVTVDGSFGAATKAAVTAWQQVSDLDADGVVGRVTWQSLYDAANGLAAGGPVAVAARTAVPAETLRLGDSGETVRTLAETLAFLAAWLPQITPVPVTDSFDEALETSVRSAQRALGLTVSGTVTAADWRAFYSAAAALFAATPETAAPEPDGVWPGAALGLGSSGPAVLQVQQWLNKAAARYYDLNFVEETGIYDAATQQAVELYQLANGLEALGVADDATWDSLKGGA